jgi:ribosomal protein S27AE
MNRPTCAKCGSTDLAISHGLADDYRYRCRSCGYSKTVYPTGDNPNEPPFAGLSFEVVQAAPIASKDRHDRLTCDKCGYDGAGGWMLTTVDQDIMGNDIDGWACPDCGKVVCVGAECPPDEFGQRLD